MTRAVVRLVLAHALPVCVILWLILGAVAIALTMRPVVTVWVSR